MVSLRCDCVQRASLDLYLVVLLLLIAKVPSRTNSFVIKTTRWTNHATVTTKTVNGRTKYTDHPLRRVAGKVSVRSRSDGDSSSSSSSVLKEKEEDDIFVEDELLDRVLQVAITASKRAGDVIMGNVEGGVEVTERKANSRDLLTLIDPLCEKTIRDTVLETFPTHDFLGEEDVPPGKEASSAALDAKLNYGDSEGSADSGTSSGWLWIVDPIDGTTNFVHGMPLCMPSIAATYKGRVMVGVIYDCHRGELFSAVAGRGAFLNNVPIQVGTTQSDLDSAVVAMGSPPGDESLQMSLRGIAALMPRVRTIRMLGSAALMLAWVANGRLTCYWEYDLSSWDIAAGALLVTEAGGRFTDLQGNDYNLRTRKICASNGLVHNDILRVLNEEANVR